MSFTAKDVMTLRQKTGLGMMDCKKALTEAEGDLAAAEEWLREKRKGKMDTRTERVTGEGRVSIAIDGASAAIVEVRTESDFTARNDAFVKTVDDIAAFAIGQPAGAVSADDATITKRIDDLRITTGENVNYARGEKLEGGAFGSYLHHDGKRGVLIQIDGEADGELLSGVCMHILAHVPPPVGISQEDVPADEIARIRSEAIAEATESGKPEGIAEKIAEGKVRKYLQEHTLLDQMYVKDPSGKQAVKTIIPEGVTVKGFRRYVVGE